MQDLHVINKLNVEAIKRDIPVQQAAGKFVVAEYTGLTFTGYSVHDNQTDANAKACAVGLETGKRSQVFQPTNQG